MKLLALLVWGVTALPMALAGIPQDADWRVTGGSPNYERFSPLAQVRRDNVSKLRVAWTYHTGKNSDELHTSLECTPIVIKGVMYVTSPVMEVIALDGATGRELWKYDPFTPGQPAGSNWSSVGWVAAGLAILAALGFLWRYLRRNRTVGTAMAFYLPAVLLAVWAASFAISHFTPNPMDEERRAGASRGLTYWESGSEKRLFFAGGHHLVALNPDTGQPISSFGRNGMVDLTKGLGRDINGLLYSVTSPGVIYQDLIILSARAAEGPLPSAPGHIRAYDVRSGEQKWIFHTIPQPGETGYETWPPDAWKHVGGANAWSGMSVDESRGLVFAPIGAATFDFYGGDRVGQGLFSNSIVALRGATGSLAWHYQMVHHDLWDYDLAAPPNLTTVEHDGAKVDAVVSAGKNGLVFVLNRDTGKPIFPVEERPVPPSTLPGEQAWPTQPFPLKPPPLSRLEITENDLTDLTPEAHAAALQQFRGIHGARIYTPPSKEGTLVTPGFHGGSNWSGGSVDPAGRFVVNTNETPYILHMRDAKLWRHYRYGFTGFEQFVDSQGYPAIKPPWGKLTEMDLNTGDVVWQVPLGEYKELTARGIPLTGTENVGGSIMTGGGLIFIGATKDRMFRAFDVETGRVLWQAELDSAAHATPCTYMIRGKQYVAIAAGGGSIIGSRSGDEYVVFSLSD